MDDISDELKKTGESIASAFTPTVRQEMNEILGPIMFSPDHFVKDTLSGKHFIEVIINYKFSGKFYRIKIEPVEEVDNG